MTLRSLFHKKSKKSIKKNHVIGGFESDSMELPHQLEFGCLTFSHNRSITTIK